MNNEQGTKNKEQGAKNKEQGAKKGNILFVHSLIA
jgi:hypothetical protein